MNVHYVKRQYIDDNGQLHFCDEEDNEVFPRIHPWRWRALTIWIVIFSITNILLIGKQFQLVNANHDRIIDIQNSRLESCLDTYEGVRRIFNPFFMKPSLETQKQKVDRAKFNNIVNRLKAQCPTQVRAKK